jgi:hypothetical protein
MLLRERHPICPVCSQRIDLTTSVRNENGMAIHEECPAKTVTPNPQGKGIAFPKKFREREKFKSS